MERQEKGWTTKRGQAGSARQDQSPETNHSRQTEQWLRALIDSAEDYAIFSVDRVGRIATWNRGAERVFGFRAEEIIGQDFDILFTPEDREQGVPRQEIRRAQEEGYSPDERWHLRGDGARVRISGAVRPLRDAAGEVQGFLKVAHDVTEQRKREEELRQNEERLRMVWESVQDFAIFTFDWAGRVTHWNPGAENLLGYRAEEVVGQDVSVLFTVEEQSAGVPRRELEAALREETRVGEHWFVRKDGRRIFVLEAIRRMEDEQGRVRGFIKVARDITERKRLEDELREAREHLERLVSERTAQLQATVSQLEAFSYSLSHDLRAPLRAMRGYSEVLAGQFGERMGPEGMELVQKIMDGSRRMDQLIQDVLTFGRIGREEIGLSAVDLEGVVRGVIGQNPSLQEAEAEVSIVPPLRRVLGNESLLAQVFSNLLQNAVKFVAPGTRPKVRVHSEIREGQVRVWVEDNGIGIAKEQQEQVFGLFQRLHRPDAYPGTGVGLAIVRKAVERMGGKSGVESEPGKGSRFWMQLRGVEGDAT